MIRWRWTIFHGNWVRTIELDKYAHPNARFSLPNISNTEWKEYLEKIIENL